MCDCSWRNQTSGSDYTVCISIYRRGNGCFENCDRDNLLNPKENNFADFLMCLNEKSFTTKLSILILRMKEELLALKKHKKDIKFVWIPAHMSIVLCEMHRRRRVFEKVKMLNTVQSR
jgi:hypothetical protein